MACEKEVIFRRHSHGIAHESGSIDGESGGHATGDTVRTVSAPRCIVVTEAESRKYSGRLGRGRGGEGREEGKEGQTDSSGSFCVSRIAAMGMPKFEKGPQKSIVGRVSDCGRVRTWGMGISFTGRTEVT